MKRDYNIRAVRFVAIIEEPLSGISREVFWGAKDAVIQKAKETINEALSGIEVEPYDLIAHIVEVTDYYRGITTRKRITTINCK